jgi:Dictyostelium STAT, coiled coil
MYCGSQIRHLHSTTLLPPQDIYNLSHAQSDMYSSLKQLDLYQNELKQLVGWQNTHIHLYAASDPISHLLCHAHCAAVLFCVLSALSAL